MKYYTYMLRCVDGTIYSGYTTDIYRRLEEHSSGKGAKYTAGRRPVKLVYYEVFLSKSEAMKREASLKRLTRIKKENLIKGFNQIINSWPVLCNFKIKAFTKSPVSHINDTGGIILWALILVMKG